MYSYLHDQTLRLMNQGYVGSEIAEVLEMPPQLVEAWHTHGYYGSVSHNVKAVYQRYLGWYDGNPAHLWQHTPVEAAKRYVAAMGGVDGALAVARAAYDEGDYRWSAEVLDRILYVDEHQSEARELQASSFEQIAFGAENGTWRNAFLAGATELRDGNFGTPATTGSADFLRALTVEQIFASIAVRIDGPRAWHEHITLRWVLTDLGVTYVTELRHGTMIVRQTERVVDADATFTVTKPVLIGAVTGMVDVVAAIGDGTIVVEGDTRALERLVGLLAPVDPDFAIVTPRPPLES
jgi:alkyl sulfatase BDS1-like metallo-beta-lactamase superfamily hydrolase